MDGRTNRREVSMLIVVAHNLFLIKMMICANFFCLPDKQVNRSLWTSGQGHTTPILTQTPPQQSTPLATHTFVNERISIILTSALQTDRKKPHIQLRIRNLQVTGVTIFLQMGGQGYPTPIHTPCPPYQHAYPKNTKTLVFPLFDPFTRLNHPIRWRKKWKKRDRKKDVNKKTNKQSNNEKK